MPVQPVRQYLFHRLRHRHRHRKILRHVPFRIRQKTVPIHILQLRPKRILHPNIIPAQFKRLLPAGTTCLSDDFLHSAKMIRERCPSVSNSAHPKQNHDNR